MESTDVQIGTYHTRTDFGLTLYDLELGMPEVKTSYKDLPLTNGSIDLSEVVTGRPCYGTRTLRLYFAQEDRSPEAWILLCTQLSSALHGRRMPITFGFDPNYYYMGRIACETDKKSFEVSLYTITATCDPFKYAHAVSDTDISGGSTETIVNAGDNTVCPTLTASAGGMTVSFNSEAVFSIPTADSPTRIPELLLLPGTNTVIVTGNGTLHLQWREEKL